MIKRVSKNRKSGFAGIARAAFFGLAVLVATGCSSTGGGIKAGLVVPVTSPYQGSVSEDDGFRQPPRSPGFSDLTGS